MRKSALGLHPASEGTKGKFGTKVNQGNLVDFIIPHESGELSGNDTLELYSYLVRTGQAWTLQGHYGRTAMSMIESGYLDRSGKILKRG